MTPEEMEQVRPRLEAFAAGMLGGLARADQRAKRELYVRGLMLDGKRKSMQPMAGRLGVNHQQLQRFVTSPTWDYAGARRRVATWADEFIAPQAYAMDDTGFPKDGLDSSLPRITRSRNLCSHGNEASPATPPRPGHRRRSGYQTDRQVLNVVSIKCV